MGMYAFRRMRARNEAAQKAASLTPILNSQNQTKPKKVKLNGDNNSSHSR